MLHRVTLSPFQGGIRKPSSDGKSQQQTCADEIKTIDRRASSSRGIRASTSLGCPRPWGEWRRTPTNVIPITQDWSLDVPTMTNNSTNSTAVPVVLSKIQLHKLKPHSMVKKASGGVVESPVLLLSPRQKEREGKELLSLITKAEVNEDVLPKDLFHIMSCAQLHRRNKSFRKKPQKQHSVDGEEDDDDDDDLNNYAQSITSLEESSIQNASLNESSSIVNSSTLLTHNKQTLAEQEENTSSSSILKRLTPAPRIEREKEREIVQRLQRSTISKAPREKKRIPYRGATDLTQIREIIEKKVYQPYLPVKTVEDYLGDPVPEDNEILEKVRNEYSEAFRVLHLQSEHRAVMERNVRVWSEDTKYYNSMPIGSYVNEFDEGGGNESSNENMEDELLGRSDERNDEQQQPVIIEATNSKMQVQRKSSKATAQKQKQPSKQTTPQKVGSGYFQQGSQHQQQSLLLSEDDIEWAMVKLSQHRLTFEKVLTDPLEVRRKIHNLHNTQKRIDAIDLRRAMTIALVKNEKTCDNREEPVKVVENGKTRTERMEDIARARVWAMVLASHYAFSFAQDLYFVACDNKFKLLVVPLLLRWMKRCRRKLFYVRVTKNASTVERPSLAEITASSLPFRLIEDDAEKELLLSTMTLKGYPPEDVLHHKGSPAHHMYYIVFGSISNCLPGDKLMKDADKKSCGERTVVGDIALFQGAYQPDAACAGPQGCLVWELTKANLEQQLDSSTLTSIRDHMKETKYAATFGMCPLSPPFLRTSCELFKDAADDVLRSIQSSAVPVEFSPGKVWRLGSHPSHLYIVARGALVDNRGRKYTSGQCVGWFEMLFYGLNHLTALTAEVPTVTWAVQAEDVRLGLQGDMLHYASMKEKARELYVAEYSTVLAPSAIYSLSIIPTEPHDPHLIRNIQSISQCEIMDHKHTFVHREEAPKEFVFLAQGTVIVRSVDGSAGNVGVTEGEEIQGPRWFGVHQWTNSLDQWGYDLVTEKYAVIYRCPMSAMRKEMMDSRKRRPMLRQKMFT